jgi:acylphosphatase
MKRVHVTITGQVQGVWFRASTADKARELGVNGYVRNLPDGNVELVAAGENRKVDALIEWAKEGPPLANVDEVRVEPLDTDEEFSGFGIAY